MLRFVIRIGVFCFVFAVVAEVFFSTLIPATTRPGSIMERADMIFRLDPTWVRSGVNTHGRFGLDPATWRVNDAGWNSLFEYTSAEEKTRPRIALLGDSYIEGFPTDVEEHVDTYLHELMGGKADVYAFGRSGWYLAQYVALARYVDEHFGADTYVIFLNYHDIQDSLRENGVKTPYAYQITQDGAGFRELKPPARFVFTTRSRVLRRSATVRYVRANLGITWGQKDALVEDANLRPADTSEPDPKVAALLQSAADHMVTRLVEEHPTSTFIFVVDTERDRIYAGQPVEDPRTEYDIIVRAGRPHPTVHVLDLDPVFRRAYARDHRRFDGPDGTHWDPYGNRIVAEAVRAYLRTNGLPPFPLD